MKYRRISRLVAAGLWLATLLAAQSATSIEGQWAGTLRNEGGDALPLTIKIARSANGELVGTLDSVKDGIYGLPMQGLTLTGEAVTFLVPGARASFTGRLAGDRIVGQWVRSDMIVGFVFTRQAGAAPPPPVITIGPKTAHIGEWMEDDGVEVPTPPHEHPRLYLRARDLDGLRRRIAHPVLKPVWDRLRRRAQENVQTRLEVDAIRYLLDHDAELGKRTVADALNTLEQAHYNKEEQDISRAIGRMMVTGAIVYDWCYPVLTAEQKQKYLAQEVRLAKEMEVGYPPVDGGYLTGHSSEWMIMRDQLSAGVALYDEFPEMYRYAANRFFRSRDQKT